MLSVPDEFKFNDKELEITDETKKTFETESAIRISKVSKLVVEYEVDPNYKAGCNSSVGQSSVIVMTATLIGAVALLIVKRKKEQD